MNIKKIGNKKTKKGVTHPSNISKLKTEENKEIDKDDNKIHTREIREKSESHKLINMDVCDNKDKCASQCEESKGQRVGNGGEKGKRQKQITHEIKMKYETPS